MSELLVIRKIGGIFVDCHLFGGFGLVLLVGGCWVRWCALWCAGAGGNLRFELD